MFARPAEMLRGIFQASRGGSILESGKGCGRPLRTFETVVELTGCTRLVVGFGVKAQLNQHVYATGVAITRAAMEDPRWPRTISTVRGTRNRGRDEVDELTWTNSPSAGTVRS